LITDASKLWVPDLIFLNEKEGRIHDVTKQNAFVRIQKNGDVFYSTRLKNKMLISSFAKKVLFSESQTDRGPHLPDGPLRVPHG